MGQCVAHAQMGWVRPVRGILHPRDLCTWATCPIHPTLVMIMCMMIQSPELVSVMEFHPHDGEKDITLGDNGEKEMERTM